MRRLRSKLTGTIVGFLVLHTTPAGAQTAGPGTEDFNDIDMLPAWRWSDVAIYHTKLGATDVMQNAMNPAASMVMLVTSVLWRILLWSTKLATIDIIGQSSGTINQAFNSVAEPIVAARLHQIGLIAGFGWAIMKSAKSLNFVAGLREGAQALLPYAVFVVLATNTAGAPATGPQPEWSLGWVLSEADSKIGEFAAIPSEIISDQILFNTDEEGQVCAEYRAWMHEEFAAANQDNALAAIPQAVSSMWEVGYFELWTQAEVGDAPAADRAGCHIAEMQAGISYQDQFEAFVDGAQIASYSTDETDYFRSYRVSSDEFRRASWAWIACDPIVGSSQSGGDRIRISQDWEGIAPIKPGAGDRLNGVPIIGDVASAGEGILNGLGELATGGVTTITETVTGTDLPSATDILRTVGGTEVDGETINPLDGEEGDSLTDQSCEAFLTNGINDDSDAAESFDFHRETFEESTGGEGSAYEAMKGFAGYKAGQRLTYSIFALIFSVLILVSAGGLVLGILFAQILGVAIAALLGLLLVAFMIPGTKTMQARKKIMTLLIYSVAGKYLMILAFSVFVLIANTFDDLAGNLGGNSGLDRAISSGLMLFLSWYATKKLFETFDLKLGGVKATMATVTGLGAAGVIAANSGQGMMRRAAMRERYMMQSRLSQRFSPVRRAMGTSSGPRRKATGFGSSNSNTNATTKPSNSSGTPGGKNRGPATNKTGSTKGPGSGNRGPSGNTSSSKKPMRGSKAAAVLGAVSVAGAVTGGAAAIPLGAALYAGTRLLSKARKKGAGQGLAQRWASAKNEGFKSVLSRQWGSRAGGQGATKGTRAVSAGRAVGKAAIGGTRQLKNKAVATARRKPGQTALAAVGVAAVAPAVAAAAMFAGAGYGTYRGGRAVINASKRRNQPPPPTVPPPPTEFSQTSEGPAEDESHDPSPWEQNEHQEPSQPEEPNPQSSDKQVEVTATGSQQSRQDQVGRRRSTSRQNPNRGFNPPGEGRNRQASRGGSARRRRTR